MHSTADPRRQLAEHHLAADGREPASRHRTSLGWTLAQSVGVVLAIAALRAFGLITH